MLTSSLFPWCAAYSLMHACMQKLGKLNFVKTGLISKFGVNSFFFLWAMSVHNKIHQHCWTRPQAKRARQRCLKGSSPFPVPSPPSLVPRLSRRKVGGRESLVTLQEKLLTSDTLLRQYQSDCRTKSRLHVTFYLLSKLLSTQKWTYEHGLKLKSWWKMVFRWAEGARSKFPAVGLRARLAHHTSQLRVYM